MFDSVEVLEGLGAGEFDYVSGWSDDDDVDQILLMTLDELNSGWAQEDQHSLPDLDEIPPGPFLMAILCSVDRSKLNGYDLVRLVKARERLVNHCQAEGMADAVEISYAAPGDAHSDPARLGEAFEYAADEIRAALRQTRRSAEYRLSLASDLRERLPRVWQLLDDGLIDFARARVISNGTAHLDEEEAARVVETIAERAPRLTTGQLAAWIRRLCVETDPENAKKRAEHSREDRSLVIEPTVDGTAHVHIFDIAVDDAAAIGRRVNGHMISLRKDGDTRSHDNLRADIATDMLLGSDPTNGGRGVFDMRVSMTTLAGMDDKAAEIPGMGPVIADVARKFADMYPRSEWRATITDDHDRVVGIVTTSRRPTAELSRYIEATQPTCSFMGCLMPARECDFDHLFPRRLGGETSDRNGGPKCRHDHLLKENGWTHRRVGGRDIWTSPLGHTYVTEKPP